MSPAPPPHTTLQRQLQVGNPGCPHFCPADWLTTCWGFPRPTAWGLQESSWLTRWPVYHKGYNWRTAERKRCAGLPRPSGCSCPLTLQALGPACLQNRVRPFLVIIFYPSVYLPVYILLVVLLRRALTNTEPSLSTFSKLYFHPSHSAVLDPDLAPHYGRENRRW